MRIIKEGKQPDNAEYYVKCKNCDCEFAFKKIDIYPDPRDGDYVMCPTCAKFISPDVARLMDKKFHQEQMEKSKKSHG